MSIHRFQYRSKRTPLLFPAGCPCLHLFSSFLFFISAYFQLLCYVPIRLRARNVRLSGRISSISRKTTSWLLRRHLPLVVLGVFRFRAFPSSRNRNSYGWRWTCSVGRVFRPARIETTWESEKTKSVDRVTVSAGESDVLSRFIEKRRLSTTTIAGRSGIQFREAGHRWRIIPSLFRVTLHHVRLHFYGLSLSISQFWFSIILFLFQTLFYLRVYICSF